MPPTVIGAGSRVLGGLTSTEDVVIEGIVDGPVSSEGSVTLAEGSTVNGEVRGSKVVLAGVHHQGVYASHGVRLLATAELHGDVHAPRFVVDEGALFEGQVRMKRPATEAPPSPPPSPSGERRSPSSPMRGLAAAPAAPISADRAIPELPALGRRKLVRRTR
jgi:cytoskeletal protein CcmA (bactofilin family)